MCFSILQCLTKKKLVFTALVVVAFSGIAMGEIEEIKNDKEIISPSCDQEQAAAESDALNNGAGRWEAYYAGASAWGDCMAIE